MNQIIDKAIENAYIMCSNRMIEKNLSVESLFEDEFISNLLKLLYNELKDYSSKFSLLDFKKEIIDLL